MASCESTHTGTRIHEIFESNFCINMYDDKCFKCDHFNKKSSGVFSFSTFYDDVLQARIQDFEMGGEFCNNVIEPKPG